MQKLFIIWLLSLTVFQAQANSVFDPMSRIDFWRRHFPPVSADNSSYVAQVQEIFNRVLDAAGKRYGVHPQLLVLDIDNRDIHLPIAINGGWIIISEQMLEDMSRDKDLMDSRLAFMLGHEISHQLENDFWNIRFFNAVKTIYDENQTVGLVDISPDLLKKIGRLAANTNELVLKEIKADEEGIIFAAMAGYDVNQLFGEIGHAGVISEKTVKNGVKRSSRNVEKDFFRNWIASFYPDSGGSEKSESKQFLKRFPSVKEREAAVKARLHEVHQHAQLFHMGSWFYYSEQFDKAVETFEEFIRYFPEKTAHLNLAASYHQLAVQRHRKSNDDSDLPFKLSFSIDPHSNAKFNVFRSNDDITADYAKYRDRAIRYYEIALAQDREYIAAMNNLACLYLLDNRPFKAISLLNDAIRLEQNAPELFNNIAVAFFLIKDLEKANQHLEKSLVLNPNFAMSNLNLGLIAIRRGDKKAAQKHWGRYLSQDGVDDWVRALQQRYGSILTLEESERHGGAELLNYLSVGHTVKKDVPRTWQLKQDIEFNLDNKVTKLLEYNNGVILVSENNEIQLIVASSNFSGLSSLKIRIGDEVDMLRHRYGNPNHHWSTAQGEVFAYLDRGVTFITANNRVSSWVLY